MLNGGGGVGHTARVANRWIRDQAYRVGLGVEACIWLVLAHIAVKTLPGPRLTRMLGRPTPAASQSPEGRPSYSAWRVGHAITRAAEVLPWHPVCLAQALAARGMLRRRGIRSRSHLGITAREPFEAHAWVSVEGHVVVGGPITHATEVAAFQ